MRKQSALAWMLVAALGTHATAQSATQTPKPKFTISAMLGNTKSATASDLEDAMRSAGYTQDFGGCFPSFGFSIGCVPPTPSPESYSHANPSLLAMRYALTDHFGVELLFGGAAQGTTSGRSMGEILNVFYSGTVVAPTLSAGTYRLRAIAGPALLRANWDYHSADAPSNGAVQRVRTTALGFVAGASARFPIVKRLYAEGTAQQRVFRAPTVRPSQAGRPAGRARVAHSYLGLGVGVGLY